MQFFNAQFFNTHYISELWSAWLSLMSEKKTALGDFIETVYHKNDAWFPYSERVTVILQTVTIECHKHIVSPTLIAFM